MLNTVFVRCVANTVSQVFVPNTVLLDWWGNMVRDAEKRTSVDVVQSELYCRVA